jgi:prolyl oligopeptidase
LVAAQNTPVAPVTNVTDTYFGVTVNDPYRSLENLSDPGVAAWMKAQNDVTRSILDRIPGRKNLLARIQTLDDAVAVRVSGVRRQPHERYFYLKRLPEDNIPKLYMRRGLTGKETLLVDPETFVKATGKPHAINYYEPSFDGRYVAYGISAAGSEDAVLHVLETATGREVDKPIDRAQFGGVAWRPDGKSFFYTRLQKLEPGMPATERYQRSRVYLHKIGADADAEAPVFGCEVSPMATMSPRVIPFVRTVPASRYAFGVIEDGTRDEETLYMAPLASVGRPKTPWRKVFDLEDEVTHFRVGGDDLFLMTHKNAPRFKVIKTSTARPNVAAAETVVPPSDTLVTDLAVAKDALYVRVRDGSTAKLLRVPSRGKTKEVPLPLEGSPSVVAVDARCNGVLLGVSAWTRASQIYAYDPRTGKTTDTGLQPLGQFDAPDDIESDEVKAKSEDGTMIPLSIVHKRGLKVDGTNPTLLSGYGAYGISRDPSFDPRLLAWCEQGGVYAVAHVRGGGEYGEDWYKAGYQLTKPNTWKDFIACARYVVEEKYTAPARLAGTGRSAGGILIGRAITERPDLFAAAISEVGCSEMVRMETTPNGVPNIPEFGSVKTEAGFRALYEMSAYHHVADGVKYPAVLLTTGIHDPRVEPWQAAKMAARLQAATASGRPVLLRVDYEAGHGIGTTKRQIQEQLADNWTFLLWQFGLPGFQPAGVE